MSSQVEKLDITTSGMDPNDFEQWRKGVFATILEGKSGAALAGSSLCYDRGHMDLDILADSDCPGHMTLYTALTKDQVYSYMDQWTAAGRPDVYQWPAVFYYLAECADGAC